MNTLATILNKILLDEEETQRNHPDWIFNIRVFADEVLVGEVKNLKPNISLNQLALDLDIRYWDWNVNDIAQYHSIYSLEITKPKIRKQYTPCGNQETRSLQELYIDINSGYIENKPPKDTPGTKIDYLYNWIIWTGLQNPTIRHYYRVISKMENHQSTNDYQYWGAIPNKE